MKRISMLFILSLFVTLFFAQAGYCADMNNAIVGAVYENPQGRSVVYDQSVYVEAWYVGASDGRIGVSKSSVGHPGGCLVFYESGQPITGTRFGGYSTIDTSQTTADTVDEIVSLINADTSGYFKARRGRDATPNTSTTHIRQSNVSSGMSNRESNTTDVVFNDTSLAHIMTAGFRAKDGYQYRLKWLEETATGTGVHTITVEDDTTIVYRRTYASNFAYNGDNSINTSNNSTNPPFGVTPLTINFSNAGSSGLCGSPDKTLVVSSRWSETMSGDSDSTENLSICAGEFPY